MSTTTQILFNSPALHSLKRDQLVKLCKIHNIKANGKNTELIERLKQRALELPAQEEANQDNLESNEDVQNGGTRVQMPRPSEQWEMVMDDIQEVDESSMGTRSSRNTLRTDVTAGEFGTSSSKTSVTSMSSSIKALATSLGIKRSGSGKVNSTSSKDVSTSASMPSVAESDLDELDEHAIPYSSLPPSDNPPQTDHFKFSTPDATMIAPPDGDDSMSEPIPGNPSRPGIPAPANARLSTGEGLTTTIRLITTPYTTNLRSPPRLEPYQTSFDILMNSPGRGDDPGHAINVWPASPKHEERLYPALPLEDLMPSPAKLGNFSSASDTPAKPAGLQSSMPSNAPQNIFSPMKKQGKAPAAAAPTISKPASIPRSDPFLFGSPLPQHRLSNNDFGKAAASVLEEMNKRLSEAGVSKVNKGILETNKGSGFTDVFGVQGIPGHQRTGSTDRFAKVHDSEFSKMGSIVNHYAARRGAAPPASKKRKSDMLGNGPAPGGKRKSSVVGRGSDARVISTGVRKKMGVPGGFGDDSDEEAEAEEDLGDRRSSKRIRITEGEDVHKGRRVSLAPPPVPGQTEEEREKEERRTEKEREVLKKRLDANKARRRSSRGRVSVGGKAVPPPKGKTSRFGFFSSAKTLVKNVWNMGAGGTTKSVPSAPASSIPVAKSAAATKPTATTAAAARKPSSIGLGHASVKSTTSIAASTRIPSGGTSSTGLAVPKLNGNGTTSSSSHTRSPIPSFAPPPASRPRVPSTASRMSNIQGTTRTASGSSIGTANSRLPGSSRTSSGTGLSSTGTRNSLASGPHSAVSSMGTRRSFATTTTGGSTTSRRADSNVGSIDGKVPPVPRRPSSTLLAPTASSLAKMHSSVRSSLASTQAKPIIGASSLHTVTHSPQSPRPTKIFSKPLTNFGSPSGIPVPPPKREPVPSFTAAGTTLLGVTSPPVGVVTTKPSIPPKPRPLAARKPRISRSRVIAKLSAQRAASNSSLGVADLESTGRTRSSMGAGPRRSLGGAKARTSAGNNVLMSAKKRARQSEYARRRSQAAARSSLGKLALQGRGDASMSMDVDDD